MFAFPAPPQKPVGVYQQLQCLERGLQIPRYHWPALGPLRDPVLTKKGDKHWRTPQHRPLASIHTHTQSCTHRDMNMGIHHTHTNIWSQNVSINTWKLCDLQTQGGYTNSCLAREKFRGAREMLSGQECDLCKQEEMNLNGLSERQMQMYAMDLSTCTGKCRHLQP